MATIERDPILDEAEAQRRHERELAKIAAERDLELARLKERRRDKRRAFLRNVLEFIGIGLLIALLLGGTTGLLFWDDQRDSERETEIARTCIAQGNQWIDGDCIHPSAEGGDGP